MTAAPIWQLRISQSAAAFGNRECWWSKSAKTTYPMIIKHLNGYLGAVSSNTLTLTLDI
jgi:hypothetical protein